MTPAAATVSAAAAKIVESVRLVMIAPLREAWIGPCAKVSPPY
jgi:hypothetical protein